MPINPSSSALRRTHQRNPTPCTRPRTQAVSLAASPSSPGGSEPDRTGSTCGLADRVEIEVGEVSFVEVGQEVVGAIRPDRAGHQRPARGRRWHLGQLNDDLFINFSRITGVPHLGQGSPSRP